MAKEIDMNPVTDKFLDCIGFFEEVDPFLGKIRSWGRYTAKDSSGNRYDSPILIWDEKTQMMYARPIDFKKKITTIEGFRKMTEYVSFFMSVEE